MEEEWDATFNSPDVSGMLKLAEAQYDGAGAHGAVVTVDAAGDIVELTPGNEDLPATAAMDIVAAINQALDAWETATNLFAKEHGLLPDEDAPQADSTPDIDDRPRSFRVENAESTVVATVDAEAMRVESLYLEDLSEQTVAAIAPTVAHAMAEARGGEEISSLDENLQANMDQFSEALEEIESELELVHDRLRQAEQDLPVKE